MTQTTHAVDRRIDIPEPHSGSFKDGIRHPDLWLWDSWVVRIKGTLHLYCLALARQEKSGHAITPRSFNDYPFHYRHFTSNDEGAHWTDRGAVLLPGNLRDGSDAGNVWSGGLFALSDDDILFAYTGISHASAKRQFVQSIVISSGPLTGPQHFPKAAQSHPIRDREAIIAAGYYLPDADQIGDNIGEEDGPILAWRDPHIFKDDTGELHCLWSAKVGPKEPAIAHAKLARSDAGWNLELQAPILLPDADEYTQSEVPKLCRDSETGELLLMISACDRILEAQPDSEVTKDLRLYRSSRIRGPWEKAHDDSAIIQGVPHHFGASFIDDYTQDGQVRIVSPYTVKADDLAMTHAPIRTISVR